MPKVSFIVPVFNQMADTKAMLESLRSSLPSNLVYEIILIDDYSTDGTREWLATLDDSCVKTIFNARNLGYAKTNNIAISFAKAPVLALLNNDLLFDQGWLEPMLKVLLSTELNAGLVGNIQYRVSDGTVDHAGIRMGANAQFEHIKAVAADTVKHDKVLAVTGACMLLRKLDFDAHAGFDEEFVNGCEDIDLCFKLRASGKAIYVANSSRIHHHVSLSRKVSRRQDDLNSRYLFSRWRKTIKKELSALWVVLLQSGPKTYSGKLHGTLVPAFLATPHVAARVVAEAMLLREEARWIRDLDETESATGATIRCSPHGLRYLPNAGAYAMGEVVEIAVTGLRSARNFYVCGRSTTDLAAQPIAITITVNEIQEQTIVAAMGFNINVGITDPILLQTLTNRFRIQAAFVDAQGVPAGDASAAIMITHIVLDDRVVSDIV